MITFKCKAYADIPMLGDVARRMLELMDFGTEVPGAILAENVATARDNLKQALTQIPETVEPSGDEVQDERVIGIHARAYPLLELLDAAVIDEEIVRWD